MAIAMVSPNPEGCIAAERASVTRKWLVNKWRAEPANTPLNEPLQATAATRPGCPSIEVWWSLLHARFSLAAVPELLRWTVAMTN